MSVIGKAALSALFEVLFDRLSSSDMIFKQEQVHADLKMWIKTLRKICAVLDDAEDKQMTSRAVKIWLDELEDLAKDVDSILDEFDTEALRRKLNAEEPSTRKQRKFIPAYCVGLNPSTIMFGVNMRSKIKEINTRLQNCLTLKNDLGLRENIGLGRTGATRSRVPTTSLVNEGHTQGREEDKKATVKLLSGESSNAPLFEIPILGMGGNMVRKRKVDDYYKKQRRQLEGYNEVKTMIETGCAPGNPAEDEMKQREWMAILVTNIADIVLFALKVFASVESKSLSIIASILDPFFDLLWGFILWLTSHAMKNPNPHKYPIGKKRMQPVGMIVFGTFGLQLLFLAAKQFITKSKPEKDPQKEKWMIGVMTFVTMVQFMLAFYCRRFENKMVRAYAEHHSSNVKTNLISLAAAVLAIRYYWWIDPTGAIIILFYTMNTWKKTFFENLFALIGRTAPPEILEKLTCLILNHHEDIKQIRRVRAYTFCSDQYFVEVDIVLPQDMVLSKTHAIVGTLEVNLEKLPEVERAFVHINSEYTQG